MLSILPAFVQDASAADAAEKRKKWVASAAVEAFVVEVVESVVVDSAAAVDADDGKDVGGRHVSICLPINRPLSLYAETHTETYLMHDGGIKHCRIIRWRRRRLLHL